MSESERELYSVGDVAELLGLHVRTIRNYVRTGKLKAVRIGKQYRIAREDVEALTGGSVTAGPSPAPGVGEAVPSAEVSTIVQIDPLTPETAHRLATLVTAAVHSPRGGTPGPRVQTIHEPERSRLRLVVLGNPADTAALLTLIESVLEPGSGLFPAATAPEEPRDDHR
ncbi:helix-turn-helix domain-containing protein [Streptomyces calidiresistens]|uniref:Helix-turn-helix domain-containing protein n=1 Tax=Streptomyces calidiresistens TaxID=1485586 RepID=A0A7W3T3D3_9ACTN|nr:helix-turn-helix domain-containing protein [Streptomyces calidiresistens]MBB0230192.1 helix-turn-helix domain-containing protein [Streptomyces calidiresistens]